MQYDFLHQLSASLSLKDLGTLNFFLRAEVITLPNGLLLAQQKYIIELVDNFYMINAKPKSTYMAIGTNMTLDDGSSHVDAIKYRQVIESL